MAKRNKFHYWVVAVLILIIVIPRAIMFYTHIEQKKSAEHMVIKPYILSVAHKNSILRPQELKKLGNFSNYVSTTSFREFKNDNISIMNAIVKLKFENGFAYFDITFKKQNNIWKAIDMSVYSPKKP